MAVDFAVATGSDNDRTAIMGGSFNKDTMLRKLEYVDGFNGVNALDQVVRFKRFFYDYKCSYFIFDSTGIGNVCYDILTQETEDKERGVTYPAWTVCRDNELQIVSDTVQNDKIQRTINDNAEEVMIPIVGEAKLNTTLHLSLRRNLKEGTIKFLIDDDDAKINFENDPYWVTYESEDRYRMLAPYLQTRFMINESVSVEADIKENNTIKMIEQRSGTKDLFMALDYWNYFCDKLSVKYQKDENNDDDNFDMSKWYFLAQL